jgi:hypothetical protein
MFPGCRRTCIGALLLLVPMGCAKQQLTAAPSSQDAQPGPDGSSPDHPVVVCGPEASYGYVAREHVCPTGGNPFAGDIDAARHSRVATIEHAHSGHVVDVYEVPCADGKVKVHVDMYGCPEMQAKLREAAEPSAWAAALRAHHAAGEPSVVVADCAAKRAQGRGHVEDWYWCGVLEPTSHVLLGDRDAAVIALVGYCESMAQTSPLRLDLVVQAMVALAGGSRATGRELRPREASDVLIDFSRACGVDPERVRESLQRLSRP